MGRRTEMTFAEYKRYLLTNEIPGEEGLADANEAVARAALGPEFDDLEAGRLIDVGAVRVRKPGGEARPALPLSELGKERNATGNSLEDRLSDECEFLRARGRCDVAKKTNPLKILRPLGDGQFACVAAPSETVDFNGTLKGGRAIYFEAKSVAEADRFPFDRVSDEQVEFMRRHSALGGIAFVYAASTEHRMSLVLPVDGEGRIAGITHKRCLPVTVGHGRESIRWDRAARWKVRPSEMWLDTVLRLFAEGLWNGGGL